MQPISYSRHRYPPEVIRQAIWLYLRFTLSYRDVEELLAERGLDISYRAGAGCGSSAWHLVRMRSRPHEKKEQWLLIKGDDEFARAPAEPEITDQETTSILSGRTNDELAAAGEVREDHASREKATAKRSAPMPSAAKIRGAKKGILPVFVEPALASLADAAPSGPGWSCGGNGKRHRLQETFEPHRPQPLTHLVRGVD